MSSPSTRRTSQLGTRLWCVAGHNGQEQGSFFSICPEIILWKHSGQRAWSQSPPGDIRTPVLSLTSSKQLWHSKASSTMPLSLAYVAAASLAISSSPALGFWYIQDTSTALAEEAALAEGLEAALAKGLAAGAEAILQQLDVETSTRRQQLLQQAWQA
eukprot:CAMPEP_0197625880 /NCGR_PEP_ID=MMETSP1338-20131121/5113_1 /TAXON_ID=43686 ORGANISM="Pelagodinium beii, Strain RCC1491" /NCGR_SAMPLE_ID=MMETSP1338 /ASSEMBLY_ACC=CAM_ASM_000754 /LENGTH=157 /DNA_ID=CAMNT_0043196389 /DNA_START=558 /DNA_END=1032 /DNA_ORIENTATION=-